MGLSSYIQAAIALAKYKILKDGTFYGSIPGFRGVWSESGTLEECRKELQEVLEDWLVLKLRDGDPLHLVKGGRLKVPAPAHA